MERGIGAGKTHFNSFQIHEKTGILFFGINYGWLRCLDFGPWSLIFSLPPTNQTSFICDNTNRPAIKYIWKKLSIS
jgi:hypothetical protein